ncbi:MAG TPA: hypothetical protein VFX03_11385, partial [Thermomicrobiales bacterium]|nr:hypothetical protein [Thermomicrobiales bacterium]
LNAAIGQFRATVDPVVATNGATDAAATLAHDTSIADLSLDDFTKAVQAQDTYSDLESGDYATQQKADNQAAHDLTVADANAEASAMASFAQANPSPWADEAAAEAQAKATQAIAAADAELTADNAAADAQAAQEIAQADAAAARDIAYATYWHDQSVAAAQKMHDLSTPTGVGVPDVISPPIDGMPPTLTADYGGGFEAGNLWLSDTTEDFYSLPFQVPSCGEVEEPGAGSLVTDMSIGALEINGHMPYSGMLYGILDFSQPLAASIPGYYFFDNVSLDSTAFYGDGNPLTSGTAAALAGVNWTNGLPSTQAGAASFTTGPSFFQAPGSGGTSGGGGTVTGGGTSGGATGGGGTIVGNAPQPAPGPSSGNTPPADANPGGPKQTGNGEEGNTVRQEPRAVGILFYTEKQILDMG